MSVKEKNKNIVNDNLDTPIMKVVTAINFLNKPQDSIIEIKINTSNVINSFTASAHIEVKITPQGGKQNV